MSSGLKFDAAQLHEHVLIGSSLNPLTGSAAGCENSQKRSSPREKCCDLSDRSAYGIDDNITGMLNTVHHASKHVVDAASLAMYTIENVAGNELELVRLLSKSANDLGNVCRHGLDLRRELLKRVT